MKSGVTIAQRIWDTREFHNPQSSTVSVAGRNNSVNSWIVRTSKSVLRSPSIHSLT